MPTRGLPTGTVTFLFTDIEGSTQLAQAHPAEWEAARARHHAILRVSLMLMDALLRVPRASIIA